MSISTKSCCLNCGMRRGHRSTCSNGPPRYKRGQCQNCGRETTLKPRGLCHTCYFKPGVRRLYPAKNSNEEDSMTMEELDALVAEQLKPENLPRWWNQSKKMMEAGDDSE